MQWLPFALTVVIGAPPTQSAWVTPAPGPQYGQAQVPNPIGPPAASPVAPAPVQRPKNGSGQTPIDPSFGDRAHAPRGDSSTPGQGKLGAAQPAGQFGNPTAQPPFGPGHVGHGTPNGGKFGTAQPNGSFGNPQPGTDTPSPFPSGKLGAAQPGGQFGDPTAQPPFGPGHAGHGTPNGGKFGTAQPNGSFGNPQPGTDTPSPFPSGKLGAAQPGGQFGDPTAQPPFGPGHAGHGTPNGGKFGTAQPNGSFGNPQPGTDTPSPFPSGKLGAAQPGGQFGDPTAQPPFGPGHAGHGTPNGGKFGTAQPNGSFGDPQPGTDTPSPFPSGKLGAAQPGGQFGDPTAQPPFGPGHVGHGTPNGGKFGTAQPNGSFGDPQPGTDTPSPFPSGKLGAAQPGGQFGDPTAQPPFGPGHAGHGTPNGGKFGTAQPNGSFGNPQPGTDNPSPFPNGKFGAAQGQFGDPTAQPPFGPGHAGHGTPNGGKFGTAQPNGSFGDPQPGTDTPSPFPSGKLGAAQPGGQFGDPTAQPPFGPGHAGHGTPDGGKFGTAQPGGSFGEPQPGGDGDSSPSGKFGASLPSGHFDNPNGPLPFGGPDGPQEVEQTFNLLVTDASWDELLGVVQYPGLLKSARMEVSVEGRWTLLTESLSSITDPPVTEVMYQGRATVTSAGRDLMATGNIQHSLQTLFDGLWDWKGPSGEFGTTTCATDVAVIDLPPSKFEGSSIYNMSIGGTLTDSYQVLGDSAETAVKILGGARITVRFVFEPK